jgi:hypothetical protein
MDWDMVIERNSERLFTVVAALVSMVRVHGGGVAAFLPRHVYSAALILLRPADSAVRRLIIIAARGLVLKLTLGSGRGFPAALKEKLRFLEKDADRVPAFCLIDPLTRFAPEDFEWGKVQEHALPRISVPGFIDPVFADRFIPMRDDPIDCAALVRRIAALKEALDNLPRQARRLAGAAGIGAANCGPQARPNVAHAPGLCAGLSPEQPPGNRRDIGGLLSFCGGGLGMEAGHVLRDAILAGICRHGGGAGPALARLCGGGRVVSALSLLDPAS